MRAGWKRVDLRDICERVNYGYTASASKDPIGPRFLRITDIVPQLIDWQSVPYCQISDADFPKYELREGDIVIARTGATSGYAKRIKESHRAVFASYLVRLRTVPEVDNRFVGLLIESDDYKRFIARNISGAAQPQANAQVLTSYPLLLPPLAIQRTIAGILSTYDDLIENNTRRIRILEEMARALYREWFVHFRFPGHVPYRMVESELGPIPEGWRVARLGEIACEQRRGVNPDAVDPDTPYFGLEHLPRRSIALSEWGTASEVQSTKLAFRKGEILFGKIRPYFHKVGVAPLDGVCSTDAIVIRPGTESLSSLVLSYVSSDEFVRHATQTSQGTKMPRANWDVLTQYPVVLPPDPILFRFQEFVRDVVNQVHNLIFSTRNLRQQRNLLLPKLVSGEVDAAVAAE